MRDKIATYVDVVWMALVVFCLVGSCFRPGSQTPVYFLVFAALGWVAAEIVRRGCMALAKLLKSSSDGE